MDKRTIYLEVLFVLIVVFLPSLFGFLPTDVDDDDYEFVTTRCPYIRNRLKNGRVKIRSRGRVAKFQCDSNYDLAGKRFATCVRGQWNNPIPYCVARGCPRIPPVRNTRVSEMFRGAVLTFECQPGYSLLNSNNVVYCDGRRWSTGPPDCVASLVNPSRSCDFEPLNLCGWTHDPSHDFDWKRNQYATPSGHVGTGPSFDHTFGPGKGGVYLYIETSSPRREEDAARIFSPVYKPVLSGGCFSFWYHMYGNDTGGLRVYIKSESQLFGELKPTWELYGDQGNEWFQEKLIVPVTAEKFQIIIEGIRGTGYLGDTAIDDVSLGSSICEDNADDHNETETTETNTRSCRGRCNDPPSDSSCSCLDNCTLDGNCCWDYTTYCSPDANPDESISETTSKVVQVSTRPLLVYSTVPTESFTETAMPTNRTEEETTTTSTTTMTTPKPSTTSTTEKTTTTTTPKPTTTTSTTTNTTPKPTTTTTTTTTPKPPTTTTTTTTPEPTTTTTTPKPTTTTTTTTTTTPKPTTTTTTPKPTTTTPIPSTTTTTEPTTTTSTTQRSTTTTSTILSTITTERELDTRKTYNLRPRNRTTPMTTPRTTTRPTPKTTTESKTTKVTVTTKAPTTTTTTQRSKFKLTTDDASAFKDARPSKEASSNGQPTTAIVCVTLFVMAALATASVFLFRKWKANKLSKMADDSELRFLSENEVVEFSDASVNDRHNIHQPMIE